MRGFAYVRICVEKYARREEKRRTVVKEQGVLRAAKTRTFELKDSQPLLLSSKTQHT